MKQLAFLVLALAFLGCAKERPQPTYEIDIDHAHEMSYQYGGQLSGRKLYTLTMGNHQLAARWDELLANGQGGVEIRRAEDSRVLATAEFEAMITAVRNLNRSLVIFDNNDGGIAEDYEDPVLSLALPASNHSVAEKSARSRVPANSYVQDKSLSAVGAMIQQALPQPTDPSVYQPRGE